MICPNCNNKYVDSIEECPYCGSGVTAQNKFEDDLVTQKDLVIIHTTDENYKAEMYKANLEGAKIETHVLNLSDRSFPTNAEFRDVKILVRKEEAERALEIINDIDSQQDSEDE